MDDNQYSFYLLGHGFIFNDGSILDISDSRDHRTIPINKWKSKGIITYHISKDHMFIRINNYDKYNYYQERELKNLFIENEGKSILFEVHKEDDKKTYQSTAHSWYDFKKQISNINEKKTMKTFKKHIVDTKLLKNSIMKIDFKKHLKEDTNNEIISKEFLTKNEFLEEVKYAEDMQGGVYMCLGNHGGLYSYVTRIEFDDDSIRFYGNADIYNQDKRMTIEEIIKKIEYEKNLPIVLCFDNYGGIYVNVFKNITEDWDENGVFQILLYGKQ